MRPPGNERGHNWDLPKASRTSPASVQTCPEATPSRRATRIRSGRVAGLRPAARTTRTRSGFPFGALRRGPLLRRVCSRDGPGMLDQEKTHDQSRYPRRPHRSRPRNPHHPGRNQHHLDLGRDRPARPQGRQDLQGRERLHRQGSPNSTASPASTASARTSPNTAPRASW